MGALLFAAVAALVAIWIHSRWHQPKPATSKSSEDSSYSLAVLLIASFLTLFCELALIRWIAVEIRVFAYFKNLTLLLCFLGFGLGCALSGRRVRWLLSAEALLGLALILRFPLGLERRQSFFENMSQVLGGSDVQVWTSFAGTHWTLVISVVVSMLLLLLLLVSVFLPLGQVVSRQLDLAPNTLRAYSWNLLGSLAGILGFFVASRLMLPPSLWITVMFAGLILLQQRRAQALLLACVTVAVAGMVHEPANSKQFSMWTPYQQITFLEQDFPDGEFMGGVISVNHTGYQRIVNLSPDFLARHPGLLQEAVKDNPYNLPFRFARDHPRVMIVGAGAGNDAAGALRNGASSVDAVEIDPAIWDLGKRYHPEHPYDSPIVSPYLTDARAFLKRTPRQYDLILFGLLDSHITFSDYSNMRVDNFVYTEEAFREARQRLAPDGILFIKFEVQRPWLGRRLHDVVERAFGKPPLVFHAGSSYSAQATCFVISPSGRVESVLAADPSLANFVRNNPAAPMSANAVPITTDDWPYLYHEGRRIPRTFYSVMILVLAVALGLYLTIPDARRRVPSLFFFGMGAGFLLLETQVISRLALYFGTTWQVSGIVIAAVLTALLIANAVADKWTAVVRKTWVVPGLFAGLAAVYLLPIGRIPGPSSVAGCIAAAAFSIPVFFAGLLFAIEFRSVESPSAALGANMLGAVVGGLLENLSFVYGMRALLVVAMIAYAFAAAGLITRRRRAVAPSAVVEVQAAGS